MMPLVLALIGYQGAPCNSVSPSAAVSELWGLSCLLHSCLEHCGSSWRTKGWGSVPHSSYLLGRLGPPLDLFSSPRQLSLFLSLGSFPFRKWEPGAQVVWAQEGRQSRKSWGMKGGPRGPSGSQGLGSSCRPVNRTGQDSCSCAGLERVVPGFIKRDYWNGFRWAGLPGPQWGRTGFSNFHGTDHGGLC